MLIKIGPKKGHHNINLTTILPPYRIKKNDILRESWIYVTLLSMSRIIIDFQIYRFMMLSKDKPLVSDSRLSWS